MTVHFVYVHGDPVDSTMAIVHEIVPRLQPQHDIAVHHPSDPATIIPRPGDILIGHPNRYGDCLFRRSFKQAGWARRIVFAPFSHGLPKDAALIDDLVVEADLYLAITGPYWWEGIADTAFSHWHHKMLPLALGSNRDYFPPIRSRFNPPGQRRFLYIGNADLMKGGDYLAELADANPDLHFGWMRTGDGRHCLDASEEPPTDANRKRMMASRLEQLPAIRWRSPEGLQIIATYDVFIACGRSDAMPCEILECTAWGLVPVTTPQCGYPANDWITHIPLDNVGSASAILRAINALPDVELKARQAAGWRELDTHYTWDRAAAQVRHALECPLPEAPHGSEFQAREMQNRRALRKIVARERHSEWLQAAKHVARRAITGLRRAG